MSEKKVVVIENVLVNDVLANRQSFYMIEDNVETWNFLKPVEKMSDVQSVEWDRVLLALSNVGGEDLRHVVCGVGLLDHCLGVSSSGDYA